MTQFWHGILDEFTDAFLASFVMILVSEIGDKTFLIAAIMSMRHSRSAIFLASSLALGLMTLISVGVGIFLLHFVPPLYTRLLSAVLFVIFGIAMLIEGFRMPPDASQNELQGVSNELDCAFSHHHLRVHDSAVASTVSIDILSMESSNGSEASPSPLPCSSSTERSPSQHHHLGASSSSVSRLISSPSEDDQEPEPEAEPSDERVSLASVSSTNSVKAFGMMLVSPIFLQVFSMVFLAEWGDRSQISTIALASSKNMYGVALGAIFGHAACTAVAVLGGRAISLKISIKTVTILGGFLFLVFCGISLYEI